LDQQAPEQVLEVTARALTYYLDVSADCTRRIVAVPGTVAAICDRLSLAPEASRTSRDLAEQCVKVLELIGTCEAGAIFDVGGLRSMLQLVRTHGQHLHKDTLQSAMTVVGRLCSKMEPLDPQLQSSVESLSQLLVHPDQSVSDGALRCFASLADRFMRRSIDPAPLAKHELLSLLLKRLFAIPVSTGHSEGSTTTASATPVVLGTSPSANTVIAAGANVLDARSAHTIATVLSLLGTLCRASPVITAQLLEQPLADAIQCALQGDERCVLDTMRLIDLLLLLLFEGRQALPKCTASSTSSKSGAAVKTSSSSSSRRDVSGDRAHRQLIDSIRCKDTDAVIQAVNAGNVEVNLTDEVGQTLMNWASAFGTQEMVEFLCEKGADVNRGQRSSSLHYAACFGRSAIVKVLLRNGANPDLRDEEGKTPLDKARERNEPGHREVAAILQAPAEYMRNSSTVTGCETNSDDPTIQGNPVQALVYLRCLLPMLCHTYQNSMMRSLRVASLTLIRKMATYANANQLRTIATEGDSCVQMVEVIAMFLDDDESDDNILPVLQCVQRLVNKTPDVFVDLFLRLGVFNKLQLLAGSSIDNPAHNTNSALIDEALIISKSNVDELQEGGESKADAIEVSVEDSREICISRPYYWRDWNLVRGRDCLYLWNDFVAIELSNGSNGWFRFMIEGRLATMYSSGSPEAGSESAECQSEFIEKMQRCKSTVKSGTKAQPILSTSNSASHQIGKWTLSSRQEGQLVISNGDGASQCTTLNEKINGFLFESNRGTRHTFRAETSLTSELSSGWAPTVGSSQVRPVRSKAEIQKHKVQQLARELVEGRLRHALHDANAPVRQLNDIVQQIRKCCDQLNLNCAQLSFTSPSSHSEGSSNESASETDSNDTPIAKINKSPLRRLRLAMKKLVHILSEERALSAYELQSSGLIQALAQLLERPKEAQRNCITPINSPIQKRRTVFVQAFVESSAAAAFLVRKLINVLESNEKLPVLSYENTGSTSQELQMLTRRLRLRLVKEASESAPLLDRTNNCLRAEPLATVGQLQRHLWQTVAQQWYDNPRGLLHFVNLLKQYSRSKPLQLTHKTDFDQNGLLYWIGSNGLNSSEWVNPAHANVMLVTCSEGKTLPYGRLQDILSRDVNPLNCHTNDDRNGWFCIDLGVWILPTSYTLRHARGYKKSALRNWQLLLSKDGVTWKCARKHVDDRSLQEWGSTATWKLDAVPNAGDGWRYVCIQQSGRNASGQYYNLSLSGFEIYGQVTGVCDQLHAQVRDPETSIRRLRKQVKQQLKQLKAGVRVMRGPDWKWKQQDSNGVGTVLSSPRNGWIDVRWDNGRWNLYRMGADNKYDLRIVTGSEAASSATVDVKHSLEQLEGHLNNRQESLNISETDSQLSTGDSCSSLKSDELVTLQRKYSLGSKKHVESSSRKSSSTSSLQDASASANGSSCVRNGSPSNAACVTVACTEQASSVESFLLKPGDSLLARGRPESSNTLAESAQYYSLLNMVGLSPTQEETEEGLAESEDVDSISTRSRSNRSGERQLSSEVSFSECCAASSCDSTASSGKTLGDDFDCLHLGPSVSGDSGTQTPITSAASGPISVSVPNLAINERTSMSESALGLLENFASAATRRRLGQLNNLQNSLNSLTQNAEGHSQSSAGDVENSMCRIMRFALTPNFPGN
jgi:E3 ubiquitin-protein ligase HECTD1